MPSKEESLYSIKAGFVSGAATEPIVAKAILAAESWAHILVQTKFPNYVEPRYSQLA